jgi:alanine racemase
LEPLDPKSRAWAEVDLGALARNYRLLRERAGRELIPVVKADGYGHGAVPVARTLAGEGARLLGVVTLGEARALREAGVRAGLLLLGALLDAAEADAALALDLEIVATRLDALELLEAAAKRAGSGARARVHLKVDTGMGRLGLARQEVAAAAGRLAASRGLELRGLMTHLADADDLHSPRTDEQRRALGAALACLRAARLEPAWIHADNSAGILRGCWPEATAARPGIGLYGADPFVGHGEKLEPVMSLYARVCHAKSVARGARIGYGGDYTAAAPARILTLALGYADGFPRAARGHTLGLRGVRLPLAGRVSCDLICAQAPAEWRDELGAAALIFGRCGELRIPVEELAAAAGTISYEILTRIGPRIPRVYVRT